MSRSKNHVLKNISSINHPIICINGAQNAFEKKYC